MNTLLRKVCAQLGCVFASVCAVTFAQAQTKVDQPVIDPASGVVPIAPTLSVLEPDAVIRYTLDGLEVSESSRIYSAPISINEAGVLRVKAFKDGLEPSKAAWAFYGNPAPLATTSLSTTVLNNDSGLVSLDVNLGSDSALSSVILVTKIPGGLAPSIISGDGFWDVQSGQIRWGPFSNLSDLKLSFNVSGPPGLYPIETDLSVNGYLRATQTDSVALANTAMPVFSIEKAPTPQVSISGGVSFPSVVTIENEDPLLQYRYTLDGSTPSLSSLIYDSNSGIELTGEGILRIQAFMDSAAPGNVVSVQYYASTEGVAIPVITTLDASNPEAQILEFELSPTISSSHTFTLEIPPLVELNSISGDGAYDLSSKSVRWGPFNGTAQKTLSVVLGGAPGTYRLKGAISENGRSLELASHTLEFQADHSGKQTSLPEKLDLPSLSLTGSDTLPVTVSVEHADSGVTLRYTVDGTLPTGSSPIFSESIQFTEPTLLIVRAFQAGFLPSLPVYGFFQQSEAVSSSISVNRTISNNDTVAPEVALQVETIGSTSAYTIEEQVPRGMVVTELSEEGAYEFNSGMIRWGPFDDNENRTLSYQISERTGQFILSGSASVDGRSVLTGGDKIAVLAGIPDQKVALPTIRPKPSGLFPVLVSIETETSGANIHYTLDGATPNESSSQYTEPFEITTITTIKARAFKEFYRPSDTVAEFYRGKSIAEDASAIRILSATETGAPVVTLKMDPSELVECAAYTEMLPEEVEASAISEGGYYHALDHSIKWGPFFGNELRNLSYTPIAKPGIYTVTGELSVDGYSKSSVGEIEITVGDWTEVTTYIEDNYGETPVTGVILNPGPGSVCYTVEALLPSGQAPSVISGDGVYDEALATVKWGPYVDNVLREMSLEFSGSYTEFDLVYRVSVNGISLELGLEELVTIGIPAPTALNATAGDENVYLEWDAVTAATGYEVYYNTAGNFEDSVLLAAQGAQTSYRATSLENDRTYYFWVVAKDETRVSQPSAMVDATPSSDQGFRAKIEFGKNIYGVFGEDATIRLDDRDLDTNENAVNFATVQLASRSDPVGFSLTLTETAISSGIFTGNISLISTESRPADDALLVREGDWIAASYQDAKPSSTHSAYAMFGLLDSDDDLLPDWWERENFGDTETVSAVTDFDHDGQTDYEEWVGGSDPRSGQSRFEMRLLFNEDGTLTLRWPSMTERRYTLQRRVDGHFIDLQQGVQPTPPYNEYQDLFISDQPVFYRVIAVPYQ